MLTIHKVITGRGPDVPIKVLSRAIKRQVRDTAFRMIPMFGPKPRTRFLNRDYEMPEVFEYKPEYDKAVLDDVDDDDIIQSMANNDQEYTALTLRSTGMTLEEVAEEMGVSHVYIHKIIKRVRLRENR